MFVIGKYNELTSSQISLAQPAASLGNAFWDILEAFSSGDFETLLNNLAALDITTIKGLLGNTNTIIGYADSTTSTDWTVQSSPHLLGSSTNVCSNVAAPSVVKDGNTYNMWYTESIDDLSVADLAAFVFGTDLPIGYASYTTPTTEATDEAEEAAPPAGEGAPPAEGEAPHI
ncbi:hypothetical protein ACFLX0_03820 [Chloroflexota bacterium]